MPISANTRAEATSSAGLALVKPQLDKLVTALFAELKDHEEKMIYRSKNVAYLRECRTDDKLPKGIAMMRIPQIPASMVDIYKPLLEEIAIEAAKKMTDTLIKLRDDELVVMKTKTMTLIDEMKSVSLNALHEIVEGTSNFTDATRIRITTAYHEELDERVSNLQNKLQITQAFATFTDKQKKSAALERRVMDAADCQDEDPVATLRKDVAAMSKQVAAMKTSVIKRAQKGSKGKNLLSPGGPRHHPRGVPIPKGPKPQGPKHPKGPKPKGVKPYAPKRNPGGPKPPMKDQGKATRGVGRDARH